MTKLAKWHVEEILENFVLGGFPVKDDDRFLACSSILTSMIDTVEVDEPNKAFIFHTRDIVDYCIYGGWINKEFVEVLGKEEALPIFEDLIPFILREEMILCG